MDHVRLESLTYLGGVRLEILTYIGKNYKRSLVSSRPDRYIISSPKLDAWTGTNRDFS